MQKFMFLSISMALMAMGCSKQPSISNTNSSQASSAMIISAPPLGSEDWFQWVENNVYTDDEAGHGPDYGSREWCEIVEQKLFAHKSAMKPCSDNWNKKVTQLLLSKK